MTPANGAITLLSKLVKNILDNPEQDKYRRVKLSNQKVQSFSTLLRPQEEDSRGPHLTPFALSQLQEKLFSFTVTFIFEFL